MVTERQVWTRFDFEVTVSVLRTRRCLQPGKWRTGNTLGFCSVRGLWDPQGRAGLMFHRSHLASVLGKQHRLGIRNAG